MKQKSSNQAMNALEKISTLKKAEPSDDLFERISKKIEERTQVIVPPFWLKTAAAMLVCLFSYETYSIVSNTKLNNNRTEQLVKVPNNMIYND